MSSQAIELNSVWASSAVAAALVLGLFSLRSPSAPSPPTEAIFDSDSGVTARVVGVDRVADVVEALNGVTFEPPWLRGEPSTGALVLNGRRSPRPASAFTLHRREGAWRLFAVPAKLDHGLGAPRNLVLGERLRQASVTIHRDDGTVRECDRWVFGRWVCGPNEWNFVGPTEVVVRGRREQCIWAHPTDEGALRIAFSDLGSADRISGRTALADAVVSSAAPGDVALSIELNGVEVDRRIHDLRRGFTSFRVPVDGPLSEIAFVVSAEVTAQRHFCLDANLRMARDVPERAPEAGANGGDE